MKLKKILILATVLWLSGLIYGADFIYAETPESELGTLPNWSLTYEQVEAEMGKSAEGGLFPKNGAWAGGGILIYNTSLFGEPTVKAYTFLPTKLAAVHYEWKIPADNWERVYDLFYKLVTVLNQAFNQEGFIDTRGQRKPEPDEKVKADYRLLFGLWENETVAANLTAFPSSSNVFLSVLDKTNPENAEALKVAKKLKQ